MSLQRVVVFLTVLLISGFFSPADALCQIEGIDSNIDMTKAGRNALSDQLFFDAMKAKMHDDDKKATELLEKYAAARPDVPAVWYELSKLSYGNRKIEKAEEYVKKAIALNPSNKWYKEQYASLLADRGAYKEAGDVVVELSVSNPDDLSYPLIAADYFSKAKKFDEALKYLDKALVSHGNDEEILMRKMQVYLSMNDLDKAAQIVKDLIAKDPKNGKFYRMLGDLYESNKQAKKAQEVYEMGRKIIPDDIFIQVGTADHYLKAGDTASYINCIGKIFENKTVEAETKLELFNEYIQTLPNDSVMCVKGLPLMWKIVNQHEDNAQVQFVYSSFLYVNNKPDSAAAALKRSIQIKPNNFNSWERLMGGYSDKKDADSLIKYSEKAMRLFPNIAKVHYYNSIGYMNKKDYARAIIAGKRAIDMQPENDKAVLGAMYSLLADEYNLNKQYDLSDKTFDKALSIDPGNASVLNNYSYYLSVRGVRLDEAEKMSKKSLELRPDEATFLDTYGWILYKQGNYLKAKDMVERAVRLMGDRADATLFDHLGNICYQLNEKEKAIEYWKKAKAMGGGEELFLDKKISEGKLYE